MVQFANLPSAEALGYTLSPHAGLILVCFFPLRQIDTRLRQSLNARTARTMSTPE